MVLDPIHRLIDRVALLPVLRHALVRRFEARFPKLGHAFHGVYDTFAAAAAATPDDRPGDYDNEAAAAMYVGWHEVTDHDYPTLFWLQDWLRSHECAVIADLGGSTGIKFHAFAEPLRLPATTRWLVIETPAAVALGRRLAAQQGLSDRLQFAADAADASGCDVLVASGSLQYLPESFGELLARLPRKPRRVVVNTTPIHATKTFFTCNTIGTAVCPYRVTARGQLIEEAQQAGYELRDSWRNLGKAMPLPFSPEHSLDHYSGFCFDLQDAAAK